MALYVAINQKQYLCPIFVAKKYFEYKGKSDTICSVLQKNVYTYTLLFDLLTCISKNGVLCPLFAYFCIFIDK